MTGNFFGCFRHKTLKNLFGKFDQIRRRMSVFKNLLKDFKIDPDLLKSVVPYEETKAQSPKWIFLIVCFQSKYSPHLNPCAFFLSQKLNRHMKRLIFAKTEKLESLYSKDLKNWKRLYYI